MLHQGQEKARIAWISRWKRERGGPLRGRGSSVVGRSFEEDLALFERQVREERDGRPAAPASPAASSA